MTTTIKICGLSTPEAVDRAGDLNADMAGFIFFPKSPRHVSVESASGLAARARARGLKTVAVTVDMDDAGLDDVVSTMKPDWLQLHGAESPERTAELKARFGLPVMKALAIREAADLERFEPYMGIADRFLFDAKPPKGSDLPGGNGVSFDWRLLAALDDRVSYMLSGGLTKDNVGEALRISGAKMVDVSSGVESAPGVKDLAMMNGFVRAVRDAGFATPRGRFQE
ncbi:MAG: phosphoribosylanthranilate isomerase [Hoeflea sp.]|uniref:phosphoribosylanthranilate isomerase n=1 Tax=Hoeflea sp. TaxID=1940281 RepID=UPI001DF34949|nr:phosphoribosylanthranilate isomerase [Hoeflea sp.]MBU4531737.1 phosphoribosylanthranilate isomerase [Alphaproteobacteria bacterium]MBU4544593.1 phosphoribosylanthranilate isomerase [Alphaproteobacteria bacterium]MBU4552824.1 phosphoribosylanthranilate isomerase [Alphaproteobacteria bacterium]MBV1725013.1 phosphoribosylanthranilate isomerase [Hoeflea sp.]MBV1761033.1 phosphoribosylanthranilate isomerase [Hoeflea sp.]